MGIIGVVVALTLPNLNSSTGEKEKVAKVKKIYSNMEDAFGRMQVVYGPIDEYFSGNVVADRLADFIKVNKCSQSTYFSQVTSTEFSSCYILSDGTAFGIGFLGYGGNETKNQAYFIDIDGLKKGPNTLGRDIFGFYWNGSGAFVPGGYNSTSFSYSSCFISGNCAAWIIHNDNMDYLKANSTGKCNNSNIVLGTVNTTCK